MQYTAAYVIRQMVNADGDKALDNFIRQNFRIFKYEDLVHDTELEYFRQMCDALDIPFRIARGPVKKNSLFGDASVDGKHIRSGKINQWEAEFNKETARMFADIHQESLEVLGYEANTDWVRQF